MPAKLPGKEWIRQRLDAGLNYDDMAAEWARESGDHISPLGFRMAVERYGLPPLPPRVSLEEAARRARVRAEYEAGPMKHLGAPGFVSTEGDVLRGDASASPRD